MSELQVALVPLGNSGKSLCAEILVPLELVVVFMRSLRALHVVTHVVSENGREPSIKKIFATEVFNDRSQIQDRLFPMLSEPNCLTVNECLTLLHYMARCFLIYSFMTSRPFN